MFIEVEKFKKSLESMSKALLVDFSRISYLVLSTNKKLQFGFHYKSSDYNGADGIVGCFCSYFYKLEKNE